MTCSVTERGKGLATNVRKRGEGSSEEGEERRKKKKEEKDAKKLKDWMDSLKSRKFTYERQVDEQSLTDKGYIQIIRDKGLKHFFKEIKGYYKPWVVQFFANMECNIEGSTIGTTVGTKHIEVTPETIATYLNYKRPVEGTITYPRLDDSAIGEEIVVVEVFVNGEPSSAMRDLKPEHKTMNKILHYNLYPRGSEKLLGEIELELLYVFMKMGEVMDYAKWIFDQLVDFKHNPKSGLNLPFPAMITQLCINAGLKAPSKLDPDSPGVINASSENKSKSNVVLARETQSQAPSQVQTQAQDQSQGEISAPIVAAAAHLSSALGDSKRLLLKILCRISEI